MQVVFLKFRTSELLFFKKKTHSSNINLLINSILKLFMSAEQSQFQKILVFQYLYYLETMVAKHATQPRRKRMSDLVGIKGQQRRKTAFTKSWDELTLALTHSLKRVKELNPLRCDVAGETLVLSNMLRLCFDDVRAKAEEHKTKRTKDFLDADGWNTESEDEFLDNQDASLEQEARNGGKPLDSDGPTFGPYENTFLLV